MNQQTKFKKFALSWRFTDKKYNILPREDLDKIIFLSEIEARKLWIDYVSNEFDHILKIPKTSEKQKTAFRIDWNNEDENQVILSNINVDNDTKIIFFWSNECAVKTTWNIFIKYWSDFCYPDDDNNVLIIVSTREKIYYCEEMFIV